MEAVWEINATLTGHKTSALKEIESFVKELDPSLYAGVIYPKVHLSTVRTFRGQVS